MRIAYALQTATLGMLLILLAVAPAAAQEELLPPMDGEGAYYDEDLPPIEPIAEEDFAVEDDESSAASTILKPWYDSRAGAERLFDACPALLESSGTWLRRGYWFAELDALILNRRFNRGSVVLGRELGGFVTNGLKAVNFDNTLDFGNRPGAEGLPRLKVGRFLFRDEQNRDHSAEFVWFGGGSWSQTASLIAATDGGLSVPTQIDQSNNLNLIGEPISAIGGQLNQFSNISFDGARSMFYDYQSELDSFEWNYTVKGRMDRDQMVLRPDGEWIRRAKSTRTHSFLAGLRYINTSDSLVWTAAGIPDSAAANPTRGSGSYLVDSDNDLIGTQFGVGLAWERDRWSIDIATKGGGYWNIMGLDSQFEVLDENGATRNSGEAHATRNNLSFVGEVTLTGKWHLRPNLSLRAGMELLYIESLNLASNNLRFNEGGYNFVSSGGDNVLMGTSIGLETYW
ncbi:MAG: BBP7 family outer membrane beta-barrel protein [Planctomycetales bacterium]|nr:BBP7 family outer membrane beta-barrel protein [Planctomycetales bacterium]